MRPLILTAVLLITSTCFGQDSDWKNNRYSDTTLHGWKVKVNSNVNDDSDSIYSKCIALLAMNLQNASKTFPSATLSYLQDIPIWLESKTPNNQPVQYHRSKKWLSKNGYDPNKENAIELTAPEYSTVSRSDSTHLHWMLFMGYFYSIVGNNNPQLSFAYKKARSNNNYNTTVMNDGVSKKVFSFGTPYDYYLALSAAYFNISRTKPKTREELKAIDPIGYDKIEVLWRVK
jgi:hypothetical protein